MSSFTFNHRYKRQKRITFKPIYLKVVFTIFLCSNASESIFNKCNIVSFNYNRIKNNVQWLADAAVAGVRDKDAAIAVDHEILRVVELCLADGTIGEAADVFAVFQSGEGKSTVFAGTDIEVIPFSSVTRVGKDELWKTLYEFLEN